MVKPIHQEIFFNFNSQSIYDALTNTEQFSKVIDGPVELNTEEGGAFSFFSGMVTGRVIELAPGKRIVQAWRLGNWEPGIYSIIKFELEKLSEQETKLVFDQVGFPDEYRDSLDQGWHDKYWNPLKKFLAN